MLLYVKKKLFYTIELIITEQQLGALNKKVQSTKNWFSLSVTLFPLTKVRAVEGSRGRLYPTLGI